MNKPEAMPEKMDLASMDVAEEKRDELKSCFAQVFPEVFHPEGVFTLVGDAKSLQVAGSVQGQGGR